ELFGAALRGARLIASAGCYATAAALALGPIVRAGLVAPGTIVVDALSGTTGAGRSAKEELTFSEVSESAKAYRVLSHQHTPEIEQTLARLKSDGSSPVIFTPHLVPMRRGILATSYAPLKPGTTLEMVHSAYTHNYAYTKLVRLRASANDVKTGDVCGTNRCDIGFALDTRTSTLVVVSALDNLRKGAASQAIQNLNLALGFEETTGLVPSGPEGGEA
ncbi:MAG: N-acetyl-gamma-glutamyl-phosphate reductase, partial [Polyangiaceae bacterium]